MKACHSALVAITTLLAMGATACGGSSGSESTGTAADETNASSAEALSSMCSHRNPLVLTQVNIVSNQPGEALATDPNLKNAWGLSFSPTGKPWVSAAESGLSQVYDDDTGTLLLSVTVPPPKGAEPPSHPTGQVFNPDASAFMGDKFIFVTEDGTISGWQSGTEAALRVDNSADEAVYKGVAIAQAHGATRLYAADFHNAKIDVYDTSYAKVTPRGRFVDPFLPPNYAPFNLLAVGRRLLVAYAQQELPEKEDDAAGAGHGFIAVFDTEGHFLQPLISRGVLNSPWGMAIVPKGFGKFSGRLLVGNFGDGRINTFRVNFDDFFSFAHFEGPVQTASHTPLVIDGLWALVFAPPSEDEPSELYFTAGPNDEEDGLFGRLEF